MSGELRDGASVLNLPKLHLVRKKIENYKARKETETQKCGERTQPKHGPERETEKNKVQVLCSDHLRRFKQ